jgi:hypothetical protein
MARQDFQPTQQPDSNPAPIENAANPQPQADPGAEFSDALWYCRPAPEGDERQFQVLLAEMREQYASPDFNSEIAVWNDRTVQGLTTYPFPENFTPEGLWDYARKIRGPYTYNGRFTQGGASRAKFLLCRERMLAGTVTNREPNWTALKEVLPPHLYEIKARAGMVKEN